MVDPRFGGWATPGSALEVVRRNRVVAGSRFVWSDPSCRACRDLFRPVFRPHKSAYRACRRIADELTLHHYIRLD
jgi:hypothetical protein